MLFDTKHLLYCQNPAYFSTLLMIFCLLSKTDILRPLRTAHCIYTVYLNSTHTHYTYTLHIQTRKNITVLYADFLKYLKD